MKTTPQDLPLAQRRIEDLPGHWLLARLGKRVLRPGGAALTQWLVSSADPGGVDVVELAPGLGRTARALIGREPRSYVGVDADPQAVAIVAEVVAPHPVITAEAASTGLPDASADLVLGEAMLTMQTDRGKRAIIDEARRVLRPGGRYAVHELALQPDDLAVERKEELRRDLARTIKVNARPLTPAEWRTLFEAAGFTVVASRTAPMALLEPRRLLADEGLGGVLRIAGNLLRNPVARTRVRAMRAVFRAHRHELMAIALVLRASDPTDETAAQSA